MLLPVDLRSHIFSALLGAWSYIVHLAPYLIGGILLAALVNTFIPRDKPAKLLQTRKWWMLPLSGLIGLVSPACTYGTVPIFVEMVKAGAPMAPAATFLVASALVNPQMFVITAGALGIWVAVIQAAASLLFAILIGVVVSRLAARGVDIEGSELKAARKAEDDRHSGDVHQSHSVSKHHHKHAMMKKRSWPHRLAVNTLDLTEFVGFYFVVGTIIASLAAEFIPASMVMSAVGEGKWWAIPFATVVSIPTYVCGGGAIPFLAQAHQMGMATGAVLAFLIAGPATRITALSALAVLFKKRAVVVYVVLLLAFAIVLGALLGGLTPSSGAAGLGSTPY